MRIRLTLLVVLLLGGCATPTTPERPPLEQRTTRLADLEGWRIEGRLAVNDGRQSWQAGVNWRQDGDSYVIDLIGPLGQGQLDIQGDADSVTLRDGARQLSAADPETLLERAGIAPVPIAGLRYWLLGLPAPVGPARPVIDDDGLLRRLQQDGWQIVYINYITVDDITMPQRIDANRGDLEVRLLIRQWTLG